MGKEKIRFAGAATVEMTQQELDAFTDLAEIRRVDIVSDESEAIRVRIPRTKRLTVDKHVTPLRQLQDMFLSDQEGKNNRKSTIDFYRRSFKKLNEFVVFRCVDAKDYRKVSQQYHSKDEFGAIQPIAVLEVDDFENHYRYFLREVSQISEQTINSHFRAYRALAYFAMENNWILTRRIQVREVEPPIKQTYTVKELEKLTKKPPAEDFVEYRNWVVIKYIMATGSRIGSVCGLNVEDVDFEDGVVIVNQQKNRQPTRQPLVKAILRILREYIEYYRVDEEGEALYDEPLFPNQFGQRMTSTGFSHALAKYNKKRGVNKTSIHLLRHTFAKNWIMDGGDVLSLQKMLNHNSLKMVQRYANLYSTDVKPMAEEHALINKTKVTSGRKKITRRTF